MTLTIPVWRNKIFFLNLNKNSKLQLKYDVTLNKKRDNPMLPWAHGLASMSSGLV